MRVGISGLTCALLIARIASPWSTSGMDERNTRERLLALREEALTQMVGLGLSRDDIVQASHDANIDDEHDPEGATIAFERAMLQALITQARARLAEVDVAMRRLAAGTYGSCEVCGDAIGDGRLAARPTASRCLRHA